MKLRQNSVYCTASWHWHGTHWWKVSLIVYPAYMDTESKTTHPIRLLVQLHFWILISIFFILSRLWNVPWTKLDFKLSKFKIRCLEFSLLFFCEDASKKQQQKLNSMSVHLDIAKSTNSKNAETFWPQNENQEKSFESYDCNIKLLLPCMFY